MPATKVANIVSSLLGVMGGHPDMMYFLRRGFRMKIVSLYPLTISIIRANGGVHQETWIFLPHLLNTDKAVIRKPLAN